MPTFSYSVADFVAFTKIKSADVNTRFQDIVTFLNTTKLDDSNIQDAGITRATKLKTGTADHVLINNGSGAMSSEAQLATTRGGIGFNPTISSGNAGKVIGVNDAGSALELRTSEAGVLIEPLHNTVATLTAGEAITANDAVCLALNEGAYKVFKADADAGATRAGSFIGFALANASVTPQIVTIAISPAAWTSGSAAVTVNGVTYTQAFSTDHNTSVDALAAQIQGNADVNTCAATGTTRNLITITGEGALTINVGITTQPTGATLGTPTTTQSPVGGNVRIHHYGPLGGFSALTVGSLLYLSNTPGAVSNTPGGTTVFVGQALSSTAVFVNPQRFDWVLATSELMARAGGAASSGSPTNACVHYDLSSSWSSQAAMGSSRGSIGVGEAVLTDGLHLIDGGTGSDGSSGATVTAGHNIWNKTSWNNSGVNRSTTTASRSGIAPLSGNLVAGGGKTAGPAYTSNVATFNGSTWSTNGTLTNAKNFVGTFVLSGTISFCGGKDNTSALTQHNTWNGTTLGTASTSGFTGIGSSIGGRGPGALGLVASAVTNATTGYYWNGSSWTSSSLNFSVDNRPDNTYQNDYVGASSSCFSATQNKNYANGGVNSGGSYLSSTQQFSGTTWGAGTASSDSNASGIGAVW